MVSYSLAYLKTVNFTAVIMKVLNIRGVHGAIFSLLVGGLIGCTPVNYLGLAQPSITPIGELSPQPSTESTSEEAIIYLEGKVVDRAPFMDSGSYQLQDQTGTVWVLTDGPLPQTGDRVQITGKVTYQSIPMGGQDVGELYILEVEQVEANAGQTTSTVQPVVDTEVEASTDTEVKPISKPAVDEFLLPHKRNTK
ncbi:DNA-binding protein [Cyanothece sp. BG0011]|uniref:DNA-binding protein n=1 Tax=Cyanothece sp. BG0011 TaxID=2082950 RepID=UPI000D1E2266|nr:DNA-binding protein [Cyanothece sp. BG0011]